MMIAVAPNGARKQKSDHPALPITAMELANTAEACHKVGACMIHLHVRDKQGGHLLDAEAYRVATAAVRAATGPEMIIQVTTEAVGMYSMDKQISVVKTLKPEAVSLAVREFCGCAEQLQTAAEFFAWLVKERVCPQYIIHSLEDAIKFKELRSRAVIPGDSVAVLFVLGRYAASNALPDAQLATMLDCAGNNIVWSVCAFGASEAAQMLEVAALGGHARVGFENNMQLINGETARDNAELVTQVAARVEGLGRSVAVGATARALWGMA